MSMADYYMSDDAFRMQQGGSLDAHPETGEPGRWKYIHGIGYINQDTWDPNAGANDYTVADDGRNVNWATRTNDLLRVVNQGQGGGNTMFGEGQGQWRTNHPYWNTSAGREWLQSAALGHEDLNTVIGQMQELESGMGTRNMRMFNQAKDIMNRVNNRDPEALAKFKAGEYSHILNDKGHIHATVGWQEGSDMFNAFLDGMSDTDRSTMEQGYARQNRTFEAGNGMFQPMQNPLTAGTNGGNMSTGGGFLGAYNAKRQELENKSSVMSLFKEMENYEQSPQ